MNDYRKALLRSALAAVIFFLIWIGSVFFAGGHLLNGAVIGVVASAVFGTGYYLLMYYIPTRDRRR
ncbi:MAG: hypothetical protein GFH27_549287n75 [Chloroflexi bacterium AL-W]|nr:hypothetical protein [Chloroflexi bacterium AL-N1]NOK66349.1 hypothetical protein [Chloroflexi bacterium AL-N10]NOK71737.1 hypothetical protein [Chloroflexi bacterium AL-N5]NOK80994.1 hypothetical protein [Chloroflexi bacterium AL-W]NOK89267.1 hypothetical protein [Chloroflexi bacterium AL-N15]